MRSNKLVRYSETFAVTTLNATYETTHNLTCLVLDIWPEKTCQERTRNDLYQNFTLCRQMISEIFKATTALLLLFAFYLDIPLIAITVALVYNL